MGTIYVLTKYRKAFELSNAEAMEIIKPCNLEVCDFTTRVNKLIHFMDIIDKHRECVSNLSTRQQLLTLLKSPTLPESDITTIILTKSDSS